MIYTYVSCVVLLSGVIPALCITIEALYLWTYPTSSLLIKWFLFSAIGLRLFIAGLVQLLRPTYTLHTIFRIKDLDSVVLVQELGIHNVITGFFAIATLYLSAYRIPVLMIGSLYFGAAGVLHATREHKSSHQYVAMVSDFVIFTMGFMLCFLVHN